MSFILATASNEAEWNALVRSSSQGSIFSETRYLQALGKPYTCYLAKTEYGHPLAGVVVLEDGKMMCPAPFPFTPYQGIFFCNSEIPLPNHKRVLSEFRLTEFFIQALIERYGNFSMAMSPQFTDLRPFLWHNYHLPNAPKFSISARYTAILDLAGFQYDLYIKTVRAARRQEVKKSTAIIADTDDISLFLNLYTKTFERQRIGINAQQLKLVRNIVTSSLKYGFGRLAMASVAGSVASMSLFIHDDRRAYYLFGANDPSFRSSGASSALMVDNIRAMAELGMSQIDFVGVNSPNRGDFKLSFNPVLKQYHEVNFVRQVSK